MVCSTAMVNNYDWYCVDRDFGPLFLKFGPYFPYIAKICLNSHEYLKCQATRRRIPHEALDNGIAASPEPRRLQATAARLSLTRIQAFALRLLPQPLTADDRSAGYHYALTILPENLDVDRRRSGPANLRPTRHPENPGTFSDTGHHRGRRALSARRLQALEDLAA